MAMTGNDPLAMATLGVMKLGHSGSTPAATNTFETAVVSAASLFTATFGETVTYYPRLEALTVSQDMVAWATLGVLVTADTGREIEGVIDYEGQQPLEAASVGRTAKMTLAVLNSATAGISTTEVERGGDQIDVAAPLGGTSRRRRITQILWQDAGMAGYEVQ